MPDGVEFQLKLQDQMTQSLIKGAESALRLEAALVKVEKELDKVTASEKKEKQEEAGMFESVFKAEVLKDALEEIAEKVKELGLEFLESTVEITDFGYHAEVALRHLNGETEESHAATTHMLTEIRQFANDAALPVEGVAEAFLGLRRAGLGDEWIRPLIAASGDLAALGGHPENFRQIEEQLERIALRGEVTGASLRGLVASGLSPAALAARLGYKDMREMQKALDEKPLGMYEGLRAIEDVIKSTAHESILGETLKEDSETIGGSIQKVKNVWTELVDGFNENPIFQGLRHDFSELTDDLIKNMPKLEAEFARTFDPILKAIDDVIRNPKALATFFDGAVTAIHALEAAIAPIKFIFRFFETAGEDIGAISNALGITNAGSKLDAAEVHERLLRAQAGVERGMSPEAASDYAQKGFVPAYADGGPVNQTGLALVHEGEYVVPAGGMLMRGGGGVNAPIHIDLSGANFGGASEHGIRLMLEDLMVSALVSPLEKIATTAGCM